MYREIEMAIKYAHSAIQNEKKTSDLQLYEKLDNGPLMIVSPRPIKAEHSIILRALMRALDWSPIMPRDAPPLTLDRPSQRIPTKKKYGATFTLTNLFEILSNRTETRLYLPFQLIDLEQQTEVRLVPNQSKNGKYNSILV